MRAALTSVPPRRDAMEGFDAVVFAYGQTASGKTFTLVRFGSTCRYTRAGGHCVDHSHGLQAGDGANPGLIPLSISEIFSYIEQVCPPFAR